jgi:hypothetical protein
MTHGCTNGKSYSLAAGRVCGNDVVLHPSALLKRQPMACFITHRLVFTAAHGYATATACCGLALPNYSRPIIQAGRATC